MKTDTRIQSSGMKLSSSRVSLDWICTEKLPKPTWDGLSESSQSFLLFADVARCLLFSALMFGEPSGRVWWRLDWCYQLLRYRSMLRFWPDRTLIWIAHALFLRDFYLFSGLLKIKSSIQVQSRTCCSCQLWYAENKVFQTYFGRLKHHCWWKKSGMELGFNTQTRSKTEFLNWCMCAFI